MLELFSRKPDELSYSGEGTLTPLPMEDDISSLSATLLDDDYYGFLIPFKAKTWIDLSALFPGYRNPGGGVCFFPIHAEAGYSFSGESLIAPLWFSSCGGFDFVMNKKKTRPPMPADGLPG